MLFGINCFNSINILWTSSNEWLKFMCVSWSTKSVLGCVCIFPVQMVISFKVFNNTLEIGNAKRKNTDDYQCRCLSQNSIAFHSSYSIPQNSLRLQFVTFHVRIIRSNFFTVIIVVNLGEKRKSFQTSSLINCIYISPCLRELLL